MATPTTARQERHQAHLFLIGALAALLVLGPFAWLTRNISSTWLIACSIDGALFGLFMAFAWNQYRFAAEVAEYERQDRR